MSGCILARVAPTGVSVSIVVAVVVVAVVKVVVVGIVIVVMCTIWNMPRTINAMYYATKISK